MAEDPRERMRGGGDGLRGPSLTSMHPRQAPRVDRLRWRLCAAVRSAWEAWCITWPVWTDRLLPPEICAGADGEPKREVLAAFHCPHCNGAMRILASNKQPEVIAKIQSHLGNWPA